MSYNGYAALPTGETIDPTNLQASPYYFDGMVAYVLFKTSEARTRPTRVFTSSGPLYHDRRITSSQQPVALKLGDEIELYHDQTGAQLGTYRVSGIARADGGAAVGDVPSLRIKHCVAK